MCIVAVGRNKLRVICSLHGEGNRSIEITLGASLVLRLAAFWVGDFPLFSS